MKPRAKTRQEAATAYANGVLTYWPNPGPWEIERAFIDGANWQKNRTNKRRLREHTARVRAAVSETSEHG